MLANLMMQTKISQKGKRKHESNEHESDCCVNHLLGSKVMETEAAKIIWGRSVEKHNILRYNEMLSDGDSSAYKGVVELNPYPDVVDEMGIEKLDCCNDADKRFGTAVRKLAKDQRLGAMVIGRLTDKKCRSLQNYYRGAVLDNIPNIKKMRDAIWATLSGQHSMSTDAEPRHHLCPQGEDSRCFFQKVLAMNEIPPSHKDHPCSTHLTSEVANKLIPVYKRISEEALLQRMAHGGTQNTECLNGMIWACCPKTSFMGADRVRDAVARAICIFNEGATEIINLMDSINL